MQFLKQPRAIFLFSFLLFVLGAFLLTGSGRPKTTDEYMVFFQAETFWNEGHFSVPQAVHVFNHWYGKLGLDGRPHSPYGILHAFLLSPSVGLSRFFFSLTGLSQDKWILAAPFIPSLFSSLMILFSAGLMGFVALREKVSVKLILLWLMSFIFSTPVGVYAGTLFSEPLTMLIWTLVAVLFSFLRDTQASKIKIFFALGFIATLAGWVRPNQLIYLPVIFFVAVFYFSKKDWRPPFSFAAASSAVFAALLIYNQLTYGRFLDFGYPEVAETGKRLNQFETPFLKGLYVLVVSPGKSFLIYAPAVILVLTQIRKNIFAGLFFGMLATYLLFFSRFSSIESGYCFGPRFFMNLIPCAYLALIAGFQNPSKKWLGVFSLLSLFGFLINFSGLAISFIEAEVKNGYYGSGFIYRLSYIDWWEQWKMLIHYAHVTLSGGLGAVQMGNGWDSGIFFLAKAGASYGLCKSLLGFALACMIAGGLGVNHALKALKKES